MPPKKQPSKLTGQSPASNPPPALVNCRQALPAPILPPSDSIPLLWTPVAIPTEVFPEWTDPATLPPDHWGTVEKPFVDPLPPESLPVPHEASYDFIAVGTKDSITWKRPSQFLPAIVDAPVAPAIKPTPVPELKATGGKKAVAAPAAKKGEPEPPKKPPPPKHAYVYLSKAEYAVLEGKKAGGLAVSTTVTPSASSTSIDHPHEKEYCIPRDFQRRWSTREAETLQAWKKEEERIEHEKQNRERVYMAFEDAIAYIVNDRPRDLVADVDFDAEDLVDDGEDEDDEGLPMEKGFSNSTSPWGVIPPPRMVIAPNAIHKPEVAHGEIVHADMASYLRIVEQLHGSRDESSSNGPSSSVPFLWQAIYPQDSTGHPIYNPGGKYSVKLFVLGRWRRIDIDDKLPLDEDHNVVYLASSVRSEIWPCLLVKALYKVMHWLHPSTVENNSKPVSDNVCQAVAQTVLAFTSWKLSRWEPRTCQSFSDNIYHQLLQYVPTVHQSEEINEAESDNVAGSSTGSLLPPNSILRKPRAILCCAGGEKSAGLACGEAVILSDIVGDTGNTTFKIIRHNTQATISEEAADMDQLIFLLAHPVLKYSDTVIHSWVSRPVPPVEGSADPGESLVPFDAPRVQFVVITMPSSPQELPPGDNSSDISHEMLVNAVVTLTPIHPHEEKSQEQDSLSKSSALMARHLKVDPDGSVILIDIPEKLANGRSPLPSIVTLNSSLSRHIQVPRTDAKTIVYRVYPQKTLRYGYSLQVDSDHQVAIQDAPAYWRGQNLQVLECDGTYPVMLPGTWNILFKQSIELSPLTREEEEDGGQLANSPLIELRVDLHLPEELLASFTHISIVNDLTNEVKKVDTLCSKVTLKPSECIASNGMRAPAAYTLIVDCAPSNFYVREGLWKLTLASDWNFTKSMTHRVKMTSFEGTYEPNKPLLCFRDVVRAPKTPIWTSFQLQLLRDGVVVPNLAVKLEVFDFGSEQKPKIGEVSAKGDVRMLQLPSLLATDNGQPVADDKRGYIVQGSIDKQVCIVPSELQSLRPFRNTPSNNPQKDGAGSSGENVPMETAQPGELDAVGSDRSLCSAGIEWQLNCWNSEEVKLQEDNTKELQYEAIRASWAENSVGRNTSGTASRLLYLGKLDEAETRMKQEGMSDEQMAKVKNRFEWIQTTKMNMSSKSSRVSDAYLEEVASEDEELVLDVQLEDRQRVLMERIGVVEADREQRRVARAAAKEERAQELKSLVQSVIDKRAVSFKQQQERKREFTAMQTQSA